MRDLRFDGFPNNSADRFPVLWPAAPFLWETEVSTHRPILIGLLEARISSQPGTSLYFSECPHWWAAPWSWNWSWSRCCCSPGTYSPAALQAHTGTQEIRWPPTPKDVNRSITEPPVKPLPGNTQPITNSYMIILVHSSSSVFQGREVKRKKQRRKKKKKSWLSPHSVSNFSPIN